MKLFLQVVSIISLLIAILAWLFPVKPPPEVTINNYNYYQGNFNRAEIINDYQQKNDVR